MSTQNGSAGVVCTLSSSELRQRREQVIQTLFKRIAGVRELEQGLEFIFPAGDDALVSQLAEFIGFERNCCRFLSFELVFKPEQGPLLLRILGAPEAQPIIREIFAGGEQNRGTIGGSRRR